MCDIQNMKKNCWLEHAFEIFIHNIRDIQK
jgi:hypothetical protein